MIRVSLRIGAALSFAQSGGYLAYVSKIGAVGWLA
jgi:hypothetical protein